jgi:hypothetical protein
LHTKTKATSIVSTIKIDPKRMTIYKGERHCDSMKIRSKTLRKDTLDHLDMCS